MKYQVWACLTFALSVISLSIEAQPFRTKAQQLVLTNEDSLNAGTSTQKTVISGYGSAFYQRNFVKQQSVLNLERAVLFVGHQFSQRIALFSEMELENAKVVGGNSNGAEISMEQLFVRVTLNPKMYLIAGLFTPRIGILNENHLPVNFNGVERPMVETFIIPATWRELGVALYGSSDKIPLTYSVGIVNGLNSNNFQHGTGIQGGRAEGNFANANNLAVTAAVQYSWKDFRFQVAGYSGGTIGLSPRGSDSLGLNGGAFGTPLYLGEGDIQWSHAAFSAKLLGVYVSFPDAGKVNNSFGSNSASGMYGAYLELGYDWLKQQGKVKQFITFARVEMLDMNSSIPGKGQAIYDGTEKQRHVIAGFSYLPLPNVVIKADVRLLHTGAQNPALVINPPPNQLPYRQNNQFLNFGIGYSF